MTITSFKFDLFWVVKKFMKRIKFWKRKQFYVVWHKFLLLFVGGKKVLTKLPTKSKSCGATNIQEKIKQEIIL